MINDKDSIDNMTSAVFDNGRRGAPKPGCDCVQCFGYCLSDRDKAQRDLAERGFGEPKFTRGGIAELEFKE